MSNEERCSIQLVTSGVPSSLSDKVEMAPPEYHQLSHAILIASPTTILLVPSASRRDGRIVSLEAPFGSTRNPANHLLASNGTADVTAIHGHGTTALAPRVVLNGRLGGQSRWVLGSS
jgi:hypothetical protein